MKRHSGKLRIIGGKLKGRKISFTPVNGLRPTADRVRETLFNWLALYIDRTVCLDLFAGSGALGLEALSRGASEVIFVESNIKAAQTLKQNLVNLNAGNVEVLNQNALCCLQKLDRRFDIVFLDPPYKSDLLQTSINALQQHELLNHNSWVYLEYDSNLEPPETPDNWPLHRSTKAGDVRACLHRISNSLEIPD